MSRPIKAASQTVSGTASVLDLMNCLIGCLIMLIVGVSVASPLFFGAGKTVEQRVDYHRIMPSGMPFGIMLAAPEAVRRDGLSLVKPEANGLCRLGDEVFDMHSRSDTLGEPSASRPQVVSLIAPGAWTSVRALLDELVFDSVISLEAESMGSRQLCESRTSRVSG